MRSKVFKKAKLLKATEVECHTSVMMFEEGCSGQVDNELVDRCNPMPKAREVEGPSAL